MNEREHARTENEGEVCHEREHLSESSHGRGQEDRGHEEHRHHEHGHERHGHHGHHDRLHEEVCITINTVEKSIHRGRHTVVEIKNLGGIPLADDLDEVVDGKLIPVADDGSVEICGGEVFLGHPKDGGSSH
jgi:hypothetical protein